MSETNTNPEARVVEAVARAIAMSFDYVTWDALPERPEDCKPDGASFCKYDFRLAAKLAISAHTKALAAEGKVIEDDWRPIDSAPKDGEHVLIATAEDVVLEAYYEADGDRGWYEAGTHHTDAYDGSVAQVVAWRLLPKPPTPTLPPAGDER